MFYVDFSYIVVSFGFGSHREESGTRRGRHFGFYHHRLQHINHRGVSKKKMAEACQAAPELGCKRPNKLQERILMSSCGERATR